jgi:ubiquinone/menaquinone biosynthesis C-methylase UbiE
MLNSCFESLNINSNLPFLDSSSLKVCQKDNVSLFLTTKELERYDEVMAKKGNCSTNDAATRTAYGNVMDSHALPFYLYNFSSLKVIDRFIKEKNNSTVLELGCNNGHVSRLFQRNGFKFKEYWGVDFDFSFIVDGLDTFTKQDDLFTSNFCSGDFNKPLNFRSNSFDLIYFQEAFDHCKDKFFYAEQCISELQRVLKPGGYAYISLVFEHEYRDLYHWDHNYVWDKFQFENMIKDYFEIANFVPLLTFEKSLEKCKRIARNWPTKFAKMMCAPFVPESETAVGAYLLKKV